MKKGYVTIVVLIIMMVLVAATYLYADAIYSEMAIARNNKGASIAFSLAEGGIQEAIHRIQYNEPTRNTFLNTADGTTEFSHSSALINNGSYSVTIQNSALGVATVTAIGNFSMGLKTARREIQASIAQATMPPPYDDDAAIFSHSAGGESTGDLEFNYATIRIYDGSLASGRDIRFQYSDVQVEGNISREGNISGNGTSVDCDCLIEDDGDPLTTQCSDNPSCAYSTESAGEMLQVDFDSISANSYKNQAITLNQYYESDSEFFTQTGFLDDTTKTFNGVVYIDGKLDLDENKILIMNGVLAGSGTINIGGNANNSHANATVQINSPGANQASGILSTHDVIVKKRGNLNGTGLIYSGTKVHLYNSSEVIDLTGGILTRRLLVTNRSLTIHFNADIINWALDNPSGTPVIEINHWEEEY